MTRWKPRSPLENMQSSLEKLNDRIEAKKLEIDELNEQKRQVEQLISALTKK